MKAAIFWGTEDIRIQEKKLRSIKSDELLVKVKACGVCGTDVHIFQGASGSAEVSPPVILGHEFSGEVIQTGESCSRLKKGDRVTIDPNIFCGNCYFCQSGKGHLCQNLRAIGVTQDGGFAEYAIIPENQAYRLPENISFEAGALAEPIACCLHGIELARIKPGDTVFIAGGGTIGLIMLQLARSSGASRIFLSEPEREKRELAKKLGADETIDPTEENVIEFIHKKTKLGVDVAIECVGSSQTVTDAINSCIRGGTALLFGLTNPECQVPIKPFDLFKRELTIVSSFVNPFTHQRAVSLLASGRIIVDEIIAHILPLDELVQALSDEKLRVRGKILIKPN